MCVQNKDRECSELSAVRAQQQAFILNSIGLAHMRIHKSLTCISGRFVGQIILKGQK